MGIFVPVPYDECLSNKGTYGYVVLGILIAYSYLLLTDRRLWRQSKELLGILLGYILTYSFTSDNRNVMAAFEVAGPLICLCAGVILWEAAKEKTCCATYFSASFIGNLRSIKYLYVCLSR